MQLLFLSKIAKKKKKRKKKTLSNEQNFSFEHSVSKQAISYEQKKNLLKKDSFAERRPTVCSSTYGVKYCKVFLVLPPGGLQKGTGLLLLASDWPKR